MRRLRAAAARGYSSGCTVNTITCSNGVDRREPIESLPATFYWHVEIKQSDIETAFSHPLYGFAPFFAMTTS